MKKIVKYFVSAICAILSLTTIVLAYNDSSGDHISPGFWLDSWKSGSVYKLTSVNHTPSYSNVNLICFSDSSYLGQLESDYYVSNSGRKLDLRLMDDDLTGSDDIAKQYTGKFSGRNLIDVVRTNVSQGSIDASGDNVAEMYLTGYLHKIQGDRNKPGGTNLFYYRITID